MLPFDAIIVSDCQSFLFIDLNISNDADIDKVSPNAPVQFFVTSLCVCDKQDLMTLLGLSDSAVCAFTKPIVLLRALALTTKTYHQNPLVFILQF